MSNDFERGMDPSTVRKVGDLNSQVESKVATLNHAWYSSISAKQKNPSTRCPLGMYPDGDAGGVEPR